MCNDDCTNEVSGERASSDDETDGTDAGREASWAEVCGGGGVPDAIERASPGAFDGGVDRRSLLKATGAVAGAGALVGGGAGSAAAHVQNPHADRWEAADSSNYTDAGRGPSDVNWIITHCTVGSYRSAIDTFKDPAEDVSAHYVIANYDHTTGPPGEVTQMVHHEDMAWHASGSNWPAFGIEHEWHPDLGNYFTPECYAASAAIVRYLAKEFDIPLINYHQPYDPGDDNVCIYDDDKPGGLLGHRNTPNDSDCNSYEDEKSCPGPDWNTGTFMRHVRSGSFRLMNEYSGRAMEVYNTEDGGNVQQYDWWGGDNQIWDLQHVGGDFYKVINRYSGKALEVDGYSHENDANIQQWEYHGGDNQLWFLAQQVKSDGYYALINKESDKVAEVYSTDNDTNVQQYDWWGGANQKWRLTPV